jgi:hypothetical protein
MILNVIYLGYKVGDKLHLGVRSALYYSSIYILYNICIYYIYVLYIFYIYSSILLLGQEHFNFFNDAVSSSGDTASNIRAISI